MSTDTNYAIAEAMEMQGTAITTIEKYIADRIVSGQHRHLPEGMDKRCVRAFLDDQERAYQEFVGAREMLDECEYILGRSVKNNPLTTTVSQYSLSGSAFLPESDRMTVVSSYTRMPNVFPVLSRTIRLAGIDELTNASEDDKNLPAFAQFCSGIPAFRNTLAGKFPISVVPDGLLCFIDYVGGRIVAAHIVSDRYLVDVTATASQLRGLPPYLTYWGDDEGIIPDVRIFGMVSANDAALARINDNYRRRRERSITHLKDRIADIIRRPNVCVSDLAELEFLAVSGVYYQPKQTIMTRKALIANQFRTPFTHTVHQEEDIRYVAVHHRESCGSGLGTALTTYRTCDDNSRLVVVKISEVDDTRSGFFRRYTQSLHISEATLRPDEHGVMSVHLRGRFDTPLRDANTEAAVQDGDFLVTVVEPYYMKALSLLWDGKRKRVTGDIGNLVGKLVSVHRDQGTYKLIVPSNRCPLPSHAEWPKCPYCKDNLYTDGCGRLRHPTPAEMNSCPGVIAARIMQILSFDNLYVPEITYAEVLQMTTSNAVNDLGDFVSAEDTFYRNFFSQEATASLRRRLNELQAACVDGFTANGKNAWRSLIDMISLASMNFSVSDLIVDKVADELEGLGECGTTGDMPEDALTMLLRIMTSIDELISAGVSTYRAHLIQREVGMRRDEIIRLLEFFAPVLECNVCVAK